MKHSDAKRIAELWRAGKMIGGDEDEVRDALLSHIEHLEKALRWCTEEGAYFHREQQLFTDGYKRIDAPEDVRHTLIELSDSASAEQSGLR